LIAGKTSKQSLRVLPFVVLNHYGLDSYKYSVTLKPTKLKNSQGTPITVGSGTASNTLYPARRQVCYSITVHGIKLPATGAYIKTYTKGSVGSTVVTLGAPGSSGTSSGCVRRGLRRSTINDIRSSPSKYYVIVTTTNSPIGALRGVL
jgi:hypothetical protein